MGADLIDYHPYGDSNKQLKYILVSEDIFSRYCETVALKTKTATKVSKTFSTMFNNGHKPKYILQRDAG